MLRVVTDDDARGEMRSALDEIVLDGARRMLAADLEAEVDSYIAELASERDERGYWLVVRVSVVGKGDKARVVPIYPALEAAGTRSPPARFSTSSSVCACGPGSELRYPQERWSTPCATHRHHRARRAGPTSSGSSKLLGHCSLDTTLR